MREDIMKIMVFGPGCAKCREAEEIMKAAVKEANIEADFEKITDFREMLKYGVMSTPAIAIDGKVVCTGRVPGREEVKEWLAK